MRELINKILYQPLYNLFIVLVLIMPNHNVGLAIIVLTILVRLALTPFKYKSLESQMKMKELQPELKRLQDHHKDDKQAQSMATMQLYKERQVNPASGCLTLLVQLPILLALLHIFRQGFGPEQFHLLYPFVPAPQSINYSFLWIKDLAKTDHTYILPVLSGISQFFLSRKMLETMPQSSGGENDMAQIMNKQMVYLGPALTLIIAAKLPAALSLYWVAGTTVDWLQQHTGIKRYHRNTKGKVSVSVRSKKSKEAR
jgi:YidC/Oxa1 family membrane protein insertase